MATIIKRSYKVKRPDGTTETRLCDHWTIQYRDAAGKIKRVKGYTDKAATRQLAAKLEQQIARGEQGLIDPFKVQKARPLAEHIAEYVADLRGMKRDAKYVYNMEHRLTALADGCGWKALPDIEPNAFLNWRNSRQKTGHPKGKGNLTDKGAAATTLNQFLESAKAFCNWCVRNRRMPANPLAGIAKVSGEAVRKRRALSDDEVQAILSVVPETRKLFYRVGFSLGLRRAELVLLQWGDMHINMIRPCVQLRAEATKARRADRLDLPETLAADLRTAQPADAKDTDPVFTSSPTIDDWRDDLKAAGIEYRDESGRVVDFHAGTRKTLCSRLHRQGVPLAVAMRRMRHTEAKLTLVDYTDDEQIGMQAANLPEILPAIPTVVKQASSQA